MYANQIVSLFCNYKAIGNGFLRLFVLCSLIAASAFALSSGACAANVLDSVFSASQADQAKTVDSLIGKAREEGSTIVIINPPDSAGTPNRAEMPMMSSDSMLVARGRLLDMLSHANRFLPELRRVLVASSPDGSYRWLAIAVATAIAGILAGFGLYRLITLWLREHFAEQRAIQNPTRAQNLSYLLLRSVLLAVSTVIMFAVASAVAIIFDTGHVPTRKTIFAIIAGYAAYRVFRYVIFLNVFVPFSPNLRMINLTDERAQSLYRDLYVGIAISVALISFSRWLKVLGIDSDVYGVTYLVASGVSALILAFLAVRHRDDLVGIIRGRNSTGRRRKLLTLVGRLALPVIIVYLAFAWAVTMLRLALELPGASIPIAAPIIVFVTAVFVYGVAMLLLEWFYQYRAAAFRRERILRNLRESRAARRRAALSDLPAEAMAGEEDEDGDGLPSREDMLVYQRPRETEPEREYRPFFKTFFERAILSTILVVSIGETARLWGVEVGREGGHPLARVLDVVLVVLITYFLIRAINDYIDAKIIQEGGSLVDGPAAPGDGDSEGGTGESRLATLLPIARRAIVFTLTVIMATAALSAVGVNVAPLFAGAGVVGLAIGFGAQTLIRDIFSGLFFLIDDAFRKGEYIEVGSVKGVIEKISVRSFQLRHHLGAVHTVPFGEITQLTNYSRDWVMMKLPLRLTYATDVEKVRRLIKKLGQQLLQDPAIGHLFLQPLKSQGVYKMEDSAMIVRVKFMTRPGDQFVTRKAVYAAIRELFEKEGIEFAHREVTVRLADGRDPSTLSPEERREIAGSVRSVIEEEESAAATTDDER